MTKLYFFKECWVYPGRDVFHEYMQQELFDSPAEAIRSMFDPSHQEYCESGWEFQPKIAAKFLDKILNDFTYTYQQFLQEYQELIWKLSHYPGDIRSENDYEEIDVFCVDTTTKTITRANGWSG